MEKKTGKVSQFALGFTLPRTSSGLTANMNWTWKPFQPAWENIEQERNLKIQTMAGNRFTFCSVQGRSLRGIHPCYGALHCVIWPSGKHLGETEKKKKKGNRSFCFGPWPSLRGKYSHTLPWMDGTYVIQAWPEFLCLYLLVAYLHPVMLGTDLVHICMCLLADV